MKYWERERLILDRIAEYGSVSLAEICEMTDASTATVRRDFEMIQSKGLAERSHGGLHIPERSSSARTISTERKFWTNLIGKSSSSHRRQLLR